MLGFRNDAGTRGVLAMIGSAMFLSGMSILVRWADHIAFWRKTGVSHLTVTTMRDGVRGVDAHLKRLEEFRQAVPA